MFFVVSKVLGFFAYPSNLLAALGVVGVLLSGTRWRAGGLRLMLASVVLFAICGLSPLGNALILPLEQRFPEWRGERAPDGIVVLGGSIDTLIAPTRSNSAINEAAERLMVVPELAKRYPAAKIVFSGGVGTLVYAGSTEADVARKVFASFGLDVSRMLFEDRSRNTEENARFSRELAQPKPGELWLLVTSAFHMPRSIGVFRAAGFPVEAYPVDWRTRGAEDVGRPFGTVGEGLRRVDIAMREWVGLVAYRASGRSSALFPGP